MTAASPARSTHVGSRAELLTEKVGVTLYLNPAPREQGAGAAKEISSILDGKNAVAGGTHSARFPS